MFKEFVLKKMLKSQMKNVPEDVQEKIFAAIDKNPGLFEKIAKDAKAKMDQGMDQMSAIAEASKENEEALKAAFGKQ